MIMRIIVNIFKTMHEKFFHKLLKKMQFPIFHRLFLKSFLKEECAPHHPPALFITVNIHTHVNNGLEKSRAIIFDNTLAHKF